MVKYYKDITKSTSMSKEYKYLAITQVQLDRMLELDITDEQKEWLKVRMMVIDDNMRGNPGHSMFAKQVLDKMTGMSDKELWKLMEEAWENQLGEQHQIQGLA